MATSTLWTEICPASIPSESRPSAAEYLTGRDDFVVWIQKSYLTEAAKAIICSALAAKTSLLELANDTALGRTLVEGLNSPNFQYLGSRIFDSFSYRAQAAWALCLLSCFGVFTSARGIYHNDFRFRVTRAEMPDVVPFTRVLNNRMVVHAALDLVTLYPKDFVLSVRFPIQTQICLDVSFIERLCACRLVDSATVNEVYKRLPIVRLLHRALCELCASSEEKEAAKQADIILFLLKYAEPGEECLDLHAHVTVAAEKKFSSVFYDAHQRWCDVTEIKNAISVDRKAALIIIPEHNIDNLTPCQLLEKFLRDSRGAGQTIFPVVANTFKELSRVDALWTTYRWNLVPTMRKSLEERIPIHELFDMIVGYVRSDLF